jgi:hypothetical protein
MFKSGEKVVFISSKEEVLKSAFDKINVIFPNKNDIVTIKSKCSEHIDNYDIIGYQYDKEGCPQSFNKKHFRKLIDNKDIDELLNKIIEENQNILI